MSLCDFRFQNEAIEQERLELRDRFNEYEKKLVEINNELIAANKTSNLKDLQIDELSRRVLQVEEEEARKTRLVKMGLEEQLEKLRYQNIQDVRQLEEEARRLKESEAKLEQKNKDLLARDQAKERSILEWERRVSDLEEKANRLQKELGSQADQIDRLSLEKEDLNRKLAKEATKAARLEQELKEYEETEESRLKEYTELKKTAKNHVSHITSEEIVVRDEGYQRAESGSAPVDGQTREELERLAKKNSILKEKLYQSNQKLVKMVSDKVMLLQKVAELGLDLTSLGNIKEKTVVEEVTISKPQPQKSPLQAFTRDFTQSDQKFMTQGEPYNAAASPPFGNTWSSNYQTGQPVKVEEREVLAKRMRDLGGTHNLGETAAKVSGLTTAKEYATQPHFHVQARAASPCPVHPHGRPATALPPVGIPVMPPAHLVPLRDYSAEVQTLSEDDLQRKIQQLLHQKETFYRV